jgi:EAL domain-containing protein (putative c-di-GMP-specific phosphodiesterase class I)
VRALNDVARGLSKQVVAEWVESPEALKLLQDMGAQYGQGYMFRKPVPLEDTVEDATERIVLAKAAGGR